MRLELLSEIGFQVGPQRFVGQHQVHQWFGGDGDASHVPADVVPILEGLHVVLHGVEQVESVSRPIHLRGQGEIDEGLELGMFGAGPEGHPVDYVLGGLGLPGLVVGDHPIPVEIEVPVKGMGGAGVVRLADGARRGETHFLEEPVGMAPAYVAAVQGRTDT